MKQKKIVYPDREFPIETGEVKAVDQVVKVDAYVHGCPTNNNEFAEVLKCLLLGVAYKVPTYAVCVECKLKENICLYEKGQVCMGRLQELVVVHGVHQMEIPVMVVVVFLEDFNQQGQMDVLKKYGVTVNMLKDKFTLYNSCKMEEKNG